MRISDWGSDVCSSDLPAASTPELLAYRPETVTDYEIGVKSRWEIGGWKLRANVDLFYDDYKDIQRLVLLPTVPAATFTTNAAKGDIKGVDVEFVVAPSDMFDVSFQYTYLKTNYKNYLDFKIVREHVSHTVLNTHL